MSDGGGVRGPSGKQVSVRKAAQKIRTTQDTWIFPRSDARCSTARSINETPSSGLPLIAYA
jgi:hypothetical protein